MAEVRVLASSSVTMTHTFEVDEVPTDAAGPVTWQLYHADGTVVAGPNGSGTAAHPGPAGVYTMQLVTPSAPDAWTLTWTGTFGGVPVTTPPDVIDIVGGFMFGIGEARNALRATMANKSTYPTSLLVDARIAVEQEAEDIAGVGFVPRFARVALVGNNTAEIIAPHLPIRRVRSVTVSGVQFNASQLAQVQGTIAGVLFYPGGWIYGAGWLGPVGGRNIVVEYEYGLDSPPLYVRNMGIKRLRQVIADNSSTIPTNAVQWTTQDGGVYRLSSPGVNSTGYLDIDAAYQRAGYMGPL